MVRKKAKHKMMPTSILAYGEVLDSLGKRQAKVYATIRNFEVNNKMIAKKLNWKINSVTGRVNELRKLHIVMQEKKDFCPISWEEEGIKRMTIFWKVRRQL